MRAIATRDQGKQRTTPSHPAALLRLAGFAAVATLVGAGVLLGPGTGSSSSTGASSLARTDNDRKTSTELSPPLAWATSCLGQGAACVRARADVVGPGSPHEWGLAVTLTRQDEEERREVAKVGMNVGGAEVRAAFSLAFFGESVQTPTTTTRFFSSPPRFQDADADHCFALNPPTFRCLPGLLVIGFQRAGTRELHEWLQIHPQLVPLRTPGNTFETHFFDSLRESHDFHTLQPLRRKEIRQTLAQSWTRYLNQCPDLSVADVLTPKMVFEKTPAYADETDATLIATLLPHVRLIVSLREPGSRLYSEYWRRCQRFSQEWCSVEHFESAVVAPAERSHFPTRGCVDHDVEQYQRDHLNETFKGDGYQLRAVVLGAYAHYLRRYVDAFRDRAGSSLFVMFAESFVANPFKVMDEIQHFAGLGTRLDYSVHAKRVAGYWTVSRHSRAYQDKPPGFVSFDKLPVQLRLRLADLYRPCVQDVKQFLSSSKPVAAATTTTTTKGLRVVVSEQKPAWVLEA